MYNNEKRQGLEEYEDKNSKYISFSSYLQKKLNCLIDLSKEIKSLNYLILKFSSNEKVQKLKKKFY